MEESKQNMLKRIFYCSLILSGLVFLMSTDLIAQPTLVGTGTPNVYKVTMKKLEISQDGSTWVTVADTENQVDIASVNAGSAVGSWIAHTDIPVGTYITMRPTVSATFVMRGFVYYSTTDKTYFTTPSGISSVNGNVTDTSLMSGYGEQSITVPASGCPSGECVSTESQTFTVSKNVQVKKRIRFDVSGKLALYTEFGSYAFFPEPPTVDCIDVP